MIEERLLRRGDSPEEIRKRGRLLLDSGLKRVLDEFEAKYCRKLTGGENK